MQCEEIEKNPIVQRQEAGAMNFQERLKIARGDVPQNKFAKSIGVHNSTLSRWERGEQVPDQADLCKILEQCPDISPAWLLK